jgi:sec-independent protein translocase protein TatA
MGSFSIWHWLIVLAVVLLLFGGGGKIPKLMKDMGTGINAFKKGLKEEKGAADGKDAETARLERGEVASSAERKETVKS